MSTYGNYLEMIDSEITPEHAGYEEWLQYLDRVQRYAGVDKFGDDVYINQMGDAVITDGDQFDSLHDNGRDLIQRLNQFRQKYKTVWTPDSVQAFDAINGLVGYDFGDGVGTDIGIAGVEGMSETTLKSPAVVAYNRFVNGKGETIESYYDFIKKHGNKFRANDYLQTAISYFPDLDQNEFQNQIASYGIVEGIEEPKKALMESIDINSLVDSLYTKGGDGGLNFNKVNKKTAIEFLKCFIKMQKFKHDLQQIFNHAKYAHRRETFSFRGMLKFYQIEKFIADNLLTGDDETYDCSFTDEGRALYLALYPLIK